jgi:hypothetical protein
MLMRSISSSRRLPQEALSMKLRQSNKIRELGEALVKAKVVTLNDQAKIVGLSRSTTWTLLKGKHKASGLSAGIINRILASKYLPSDARAKALEYVYEKASGYYGHGKPARRRFVNQLSATSIGRRNLDRLLSE